MKNEKISNSAHFSLHHTLQLTVIANRMNGNILYASVTSQIDECEKTQSQRGNDEPALVFGLT